MTDTSGTDLTNTQINVKSLGSPDIIPNTDITLLTNVEKIDVSGYTTGEVLTQGVSVNYPVSIEVSDDNKSIIAKVGSEGTFNEKMDVINVKPAVDIPITELPDNIDETFSEFDLNNDEINTEENKNLSEVT